jgi:hypothetical protein
MFLNFIETIDYRLEKHNNTYLTIYHLVAQKIKYYLEIDFYNYKRVYETLDKYSKYIKQIQQYLIKQTSSMSSDFNYVSEKCYETDCLLSFWLINIIPEFNVEHAINILKKLIEYGANVNIILLTIIRNNSKKDFTKEAIKILINEYKADSFFSEDSPIYYITPPICFSDDEKQIKFLLKNKSFFDFQKIYEKLEKYEKQFYFHSKNKKINDILYKLKSIEKIFTTNINNILLKNTNIPEELINKIIKLF